MESPSFLRRTRSAGLRSLLVEILALGGFIVVGVILALVFTSR